MKRTRIGVSLVALFLLPCSGLPAAHFQKSGNYALVAGTVFRDTGFSLPNADIMLAAKTPPEGVKKFRPLRTVSDARGEFAFRVPAAKAEYTLTVKADGFQPEQRDVTVAGDERSDIYFELKPASPGRK